MTTKEATRKRLQKHYGLKGALKRILEPGYDGLAATERARRGYWAKLEAEVDPLEWFDPEKRHDLAVKLWQLRMAEGRIKAAQKRLRKRGA